MRISGDPLTYLTLCFLLIAVVSGPLVSSIDLTSTSRSLPESKSALTTGNSSLTAAQVDIPTDGYQLESGIAGSGIHKLQTPIANLTLESVSGRVLLSYVVRIPDLGIQSSSVYFVDSDSPQQLALAIDEMTIPSHRIDDQSYSGTIEIVVRKSQTTRVVANESITISVG